MKVLIVLLGIIMLAGVGIPLAVGAVDNDSKNTVNGLYWILNETQILKDGKPIHTANGKITYPCKLNGGNLIAYTQNHTKVVVVDLNTGNKKFVYKVGGKETVSYREGSKEFESAKAVGFSPDGKYVYVMGCASYVYVGGNKLIRISLSNLKQTVLDAGVADAAVSANGDLVITKPDLVQVLQKSGESWEVEPKHRSIFVMGVGFTRENKPFYYTTDSINLLGPGGIEETIKIKSKIDSRPIVMDSIVIWDNGQKILSNTEGAVSRVSRIGSNRQPFM